jgi:hypothetical protein
MTFSASYFSGGISTRILCSSGVLGAHCATPPEAGSQKIVLRRSSKFERSII